MIGEEKERLEGKTKSQLMKDEEYRWRVRANLGELGRVFKVLGDFGRVLRRVILTRQVFRRVRASFISAEISKLDKIAVLPGAPGIASNSTPRKVRLQFFTI